MWVILPAWRREVAGLTYDLHIHSCLSPCAEDTMTPANIAGFAKLNGIDLIAVTDHNSALNLPAVQKACDAYGVQLLPGIEVNTQEEIHILTYFSNIKAALEMGRLLYEGLPELPYEREIWGRQLVLDEQDTLLHQPEKLLTGASAYNVYEIQALCHKLGGIAVPAHVDRDSYSLLSVLGFAPEDLPFAAYELHKPEHMLNKLVQAGRMPGDVQILSSSDAHRLEDIAEYPRELEKNSILMQLLR